MVLMAVFVLPHGGLRPVIRRSSAGGASSTRRTLPRRQLRVHARRQPAARLPGRGARRLRRADGTGVLATVAVAAGTLLTLIWPFAGVLHDVALDTAADGTDLRILGGWDAVAPYSPAPSPALPRLFFIGAIVLGLRMSRERADAAAPRGRPAAAEPGRHRHAGRRGPSRCSRSARSATSCGSAPSRGTGCGRRAEADPAVGRAEETAARPMATSYFRRTRAAGGCRTLSRWVGSGGSSRPGGSTSWSWPPRRPARSGRCCATMRTGRTVWRCGSRSSRSPWCSCLCWPAGGSRSSLRRSSGSVPLALSFLDHQLISTQAGVFLCGMGAAVLFGSLRNGLQSRVGLVIVLVGAAVVVYHDPTHTTGDLFFTPVLFAVALARGLRAARPGGTQTRPPRSGRCGPSGSGSRRRGWRWPRSGPGWRASSTTWSPTR